MVDYAHPERPGERLSHAEREAAVRDLTQHETDGRITAAELDERASAAKAATTRGDLVALFADLPELPGPRPGPAQPGYASAAPHPGAVQHPGAAPRPGDAQPGSGAPHPGAAPHPGGAPQPGPAQRQPAFAEPYPYGPAPQHHGRDRARYHDGGYSYRGSRHHGRPLGGRVGASIMAATPIVAVILFFVTGFIFGFQWSWMWFLVIPVVGAVIYAPWYEDDDEE